ncbi:MAG: hypothetical protein NC541_13665 [bacterium]|nr:hypothetical protein [bacterium]
MAIVSCKAVRKATAGSSERKRRNKKAIGRREQEAAEVERTEIWESLLWRRTKLFFGGGTS